MRNHVGALLIVGVCFAGCTAMRQNANNQNEEDGEGNEVKMPFDQVPAAAQATLKRESNGATISSVDMEKDGGKTVYETDAVVDGTNYEIKVDNAGHLISKKVDNEAAESSGQGEKHDKGDKD